MSQGVLLAFVDAIGMGWFLVLVDGGLVGPKTLLYLHCAGFLLRLRI